SRRSLMRCKVWRELILPRPSAARLGLCFLGFVVYCLLFNGRPNILRPSNLTETMKKSVLTFITVLIGAAFVVSCTQQGTTATSTRGAAAAKVSPSPSPRAHKKTAAKKKEAAGAEE